MAIAVEGAIKGHTWIWGAPTFDQVRIGWEESRKAAGGVAQFHQSTMTAHFPTGGRIVYRSLDDPDNARGHTADGAIIDEAGDVAERAWYEVIRPMLIDTNGGAWLIGTPKGRNWFWREYVAALDREDSARWQIPTLGCRIEGSELVREPHALENPDIPWSEIQHIYATTPEDVFRQEILAEFLENQGAVFRNIAACLHATPHPVIGRHRGHKIVAGLDLAKQHDYTAISVICADCGQELALERFNRMDYVLQMERIKAICQQWRVEELLVDESGVGSPLVEQLRRDLA
jgi:hypothetical protein